MKATVRVEPTDKKRQLLLQTKRKERPRPLTRRQSRTKVMFLLFLVRLPRSEAERRSPIKSTSAGLSKRSKKSRIS